MIAYGNCVEHHVATGSSKTYTFPFRFDAKTDIVVTTRVVDVVTELTYSTHYTVTTPSPDGGTVTITVTPAAGTFVAVSRRQGLTQDTEFPNNAGFGRAKHEDQFDECTMFDQEQDVELSAAVRTKFMNAEYNTELPRDVELRGGAGITVNGTDGLTWADDLVAIGGVGADVALAVAYADSALASADAADSAAADVVASGTSALASSESVADTYALLGMVVSSVHTTSFTADVGVVNLYDPTGGTFQIALPAADTVGEMLIIKNDTASVTAVNVACAGSDTIEVLDTEINMVYPYHAYSWMSDGNGSWMEMSRYDEGYDSPLPELAYVDDETITVRQKPGWPDFVILTMQDGRRYHKEGELELDLAASGLGGIDTGSLAISTWYYAYCVTQNRDNLGVVFSVTPPADGGPTGYTDRWRYIGAFRTDADGDLVAFVQLGRRFHPKYSHDIPKAVDENAFDTAQHDVNKWHYASDVTALDVCTPLTRSMVQIAAWIDSDGTSYYPKMSHVRCSSVDIDGDTFTCSLRGMSTTVVYNDTNKVEFWIPSDGDSDLFWCYDNTSGGQNVDLRMKTIAYEDGYLP